MKKTIFVIFITVLSNVNGAIILVNQSGTGGKRLTSIGTNDWNTSAFNNLQLAIDSAQYGDEIWVKAGTYFPIRNPFTGASISLARKNSFILKSGLKIYGGFSGSETNLNQRNHKLNISRISSDYSSNDSFTLGYQSYYQAYSVVTSNQSENAYHCIIIANNQNILIDGLSIAGGAADANVYDSVNNSEIYHRYGGGLYVVNAKNITINNCRFQKNSAEYSGGALFVENSDSLFLNKNFYTLNLSSNGNGGALQYITTSNIVHNNDSFYRNSAAYNGGAIDVYISKMKLLKCLFNDNHTSFVSSGNIFHKGAAVMSANTNLVLHQCNFINNTTRISINCSGGAIYFTSDTLNVDSSFFENNRSYGNGGAIHKQGGFSVIKNSVFKDNNSEWGSSIYNYGNMKLRNCIFDGNTNNSLALAAFKDTIYNCVFNSYYQSDFISLSNGRLNLHNCTLYAKTKTTSFLNYALQKDTIIIQNSILWNLSNSNGFPIDLTAAKPNYFVNYSNLSGPTVFSGNGNINSNPLFIDTSFNGSGNDGKYFTLDDGFNVSKNSLSVNSGTNSNLLPIDILGNKRISNCTVDMGAYEYFIPFAGRDTSVCLGSQVGIGVDSVSNYSYLWAGSDIIGSASKAKTNIQPLSAGIKQYIVTATHIPTGCINVDTVLINIVNPPSLFAGNDTVICEGDSIRLNAVSSSAFDSIVWNISNFSNNQFVKPTVSNTFIVKIYHSNCMSTDSVYLNVLKKPNILVQPIPSTNCLNSNSLLLVTSNNPHDSFAWFRNNAIILNSNNDTIAITNIDSSKIGTYKVSISNKCGVIVSNSASLTLRDSIFISPVNFTLDTICSGSSFTKSISAIGYNLLYQWKRNNNSLTGGNTLSYLKSNVTINDSGLYSLHIIDGCNLTKTVSVGSLKVLPTIFPLASINTNKTIICDNNNITINYSNSNTGINPKINWIINNQIVSNQFQNYIYKPKNGDRIQVNITPSELCSSPKTALSNVINIGVSKPTRDTTYKNICDNESFIFSGKIFITAGFYTVNLKNSIGCDSIKDLVLTKTSINNSTSSTNGILNSLQNSAIYQWYDCNGNVKIPNETKQSFKPLKTGNYKVQIKKDNCTIESICKQVIVSNSSVNNIEHSGISFYPNPIRNIIYFTNQKLIHFYVSIYDLNGKEIVLNLKNPNEVDLSLYTRGIFNLIIYDKNFNIISYSKIMKE